MPAIINGRHVKDSERGDNRTLGRRAVVVATRQPVEPTRFTKVCRTEVASQLGVNHPIVVATVIPPRGSAQLILARA